ncbi:SRPBCC family protein, partial [Intrasporangium oryzae]|uniref:hypothetical protein n=1 Tax=Intrasporangium oryzae TaxID=412687 RepID=UPI0012FCE1F3
MMQRLLGEQLSRRPMPPVERLPLVVRHRVLIAAPLELAWQRAVAPRRGSSADAGATCVAVVPLPHVGPATEPEFVGIWRRSDGRVRVGISAVVALDRHVRVVARSADGPAPLTLTTTFEAVDEGCIVEQRDLSARFETGVVTTIEPRGTGSRLTESFTGWLPHGAGAASGGAPVAALLRTRLEAVRRLAEA